MTILKEWSIGEIFSHTLRFFESFAPPLSFMWKRFEWLGKRRRQRPYHDDIIALAASLKEGTESP